MSGFVAVHVGAGHHSEKRTPSYLNLCSNACKIAVDILNSDGGTALEAVTHATTILEDSPLTNAGVGSNLTECGGVELDAGLMSSVKETFASVGAVINIKNPILVCNKLLKGQLDGPLPLGRVPPMTLCGEGATRWAKLNGISLVDTPDALMTGKSSRLYHHYKSLLVTTSGKLRERKRKKADYGHTENDHVTDTVGVIAINTSTGEIVSSVSSGGIALKQSGRVGHASVFGCGAWAEIKGAGSECVAISTTGCGEHLIRTRLAQEIGNGLTSECDSFTSVRGVMEEKFLNSPYLKNVREKLGGGICLNYNPHEDVLDFISFHTTHSLGFAFQSTSQSTASRRMSRLPCGSAIGVSCAVETTHLSFLNS